MKLSIGRRMFLALLCAALVVAAAGVELVRWSLFDNFSAHSEPFDWRRLDALADVLRARYRAAHGWSFLPDDAASRKRWLADAWRAAANGTADTTADTPTLPYRLALLDADERYLAGRRANPFTIAFASLDTLQRPLEVDGSTVGALVVAQAQNPDDDLAVAFLVDRQDRLLLIALGATAAIALLAAALAAHFRRPIAQLAGGARRLSQGDYGARLDLQRSDELGELGAAFDRLAARLEQAEQERRQWIADTSHELRTPLAVLQAQLEAIEDGVRTATPEHVALLLRQTHFLTRLVEDLNQLALADAGRLQLAPAACDAWALLQDVFAAAAERLHAAQLDATLGAKPARSTIVADAARLRQVFTNLLENSARHTDAPGRVAVHGDVVDGALRIAFDDSAPGVPAALQARLGERFFRADASRSRRSGGAGLGLALCRQIVQAHGGRMDFADSPLGGLRVTLALPLAAA